MHMNVSACLAGQCLGLDIAPAATRASQRGYEQHLDSTAGGSRTRPICRNAGGRLLHNLRLQRSLFLAQLLCQTQLLQPQLLDLHHKDTQSAAYHWQNEHCVNSQNAHNSLAAQLLNVLFMDVIAAIRSATEQQAPDLDPV